MKAHLIVRIPLMVVFCSAGISLLVNNIYAQEQTPDTLRFIAGGGLLFQGLFWDPVELESTLSATFASDFSLGDQPLFWSLGGYGFGGKLTRIGGMGASARWIGTVRQKPFESVHLGLSYEGLFLEQTILKNDFISISVGGMIGNGTWRIDLIKGEVDSFHDVVRQPNTTSLLRDFLAFQPYLGFEKRAFGVLGINVLAGVLGAWGFDSWRLPDRTAVLGKPLSLSLIPTLNIIFVLGV